MIVAALPIAQVAYGQPIVAKVKVHNPSDEIADVVIRGALPLPADYDKPVSNLTLVDGGNELVTQASVFSTYPGSSDRFPVGRPEVVQLAARVSLPANGFKEFDVVEVARALQTKTVSPGAAVTKLLSAGAPVVVEATDVYGNCKETGEFLDKPIGDSPCDFYLGSPLAWYYELTGERIFLERLNEMAGDQGLAARSSEQLRNWSYSLWLAQGGRIPSR